MPEPKFSDLLSIFSWKFYYAVLHIMLTDFHPVVQAVILSPMFLVCFFLGSAIRKRREEGSRGCCNFFFFSQQVRFLILLTMDNFKFHWLYIMIFFNDMSLFTSHGYLIFTRSTGMAKIRLSSLKKKKSRQNPSMD